MGPVQNSPKSIQCEQNEQKDKPLEFFMKKLLEMNEQWMKSMNELTLEVKKLTLNSERQQKAEAQSELVNKVTHYFMTHFQYSCKAYSDKSARDRKTREAIRGEVEELCKKYFFSKLNAGRTVSQVYEDFIREEPFFERYPLTAQKGHLIGLYIGIKNELPFYVNLRHLLC